MNGLGTNPLQTDQPNAVQVACNRCSVGVMDATNPHRIGTCACSCHVADQPNAAERAEPVSEKDLARWEAVEPRQITGRPTNYYGYVMQSHQPRTLRHCHEPGQHSSVTSARGCAEQAARKLNAAEHAEPVSERLSDAELNGLLLSDVMHRDGRVRQEARRAILAEVRTLRAELEQAPWRASYHAATKRAQEAESALASEREKVATQRALLVSVAEFLGPIAISPSGKRLYAAVLSVLDTTNEGAETE